MLLQRDALGELDHERRALTQGARYTDRSTVGLDDASGDVEPDAESAVVPERCGTLESSENSIDVFRRDADSVIRYRETGRGGRALHANIDRVSPSVLDGVGYQVDD